LQAAALQTLSSRLLGGGNIFFLDRLQLEVRPPQLPNPVAQGQNARKTSHGRKLLARVRVCCSRRTRVQTVCLTPRRFPSKLRLNKHMRSRTHRIRFLALLLGIIFLGVQFHFCTDLTVTPSASHICPICSTTGSAVATHSPSMAVVPVANRLEIVSSVNSVFSVFSPAISPRAPPAL
jgi:hypothetical protein